MGKPKRIIIVRHGESMSNAFAITRERVPDHRVDLTPRGRQQAIDVGNELFDKYIRKESFGIWVAPWARTRQTVECMLKSRLGTGKLTKVTEDPRIREQEHGHLRSVKVAKRIEKERDSYSRFWYRFPDGESGADVFDRISTWLETLHRDFKKARHPKNLIVGSHGFTGRIIVMRWLHYSVEQFELLRNPPNCGYFVLELQPDDRYKLVRDPY